MVRNNDILNELKELNCSALLTADNTNVYSCDPGYFLELETNVRRSIWLTTLPKTVLYDVPENYFVNFPEMLVDKLSVSNSNLYSGKMYAVPPDYFNHLSANILSKINNTLTAKQELEQLSPLLGKISKANVYSLPEGYFNNTIPVPSSKTKVISIASKTRKWLNYAAAACVAAVLFGAGLLYVNNRSVNHIGQSQTADMNVQNAVSQLSDSEINSYLANDVPDFNAAQNNDDQDINVKTLLENTSDSEIDDYLKQHPEPADDTKGI